MEYMSNVWKQAINWAKMKFKNTESTSQKGEEKLQIFVEHIGLSFGHYVHKTAVEKPCK